MIQPYGRIIAENNFSRPKLMTNSDSDRRINQIASPTI